MRCDWDANLRRWLRFDFQSGPNCFKAIAARISGRGKIKSLFWRFGHSCGGSRLQRQPQFQPIQDCRNLGAEAMRAIRVAMLQLGSDGLQPLTVGAMLFDQLLKLGNRILEMGPLLGHAANRPSASFRA
jgi:hypothetical protein